MKFPPFDKVLAYLPARLEFDAELARGPLSVERFLNAVRAAEARYVPPPSLDDDDE
jgi:hypothetical protein